MALLVYLHFKAYAANTVVLKRVMPGDICPPTQRHVEDNYNFITLWDNATALLGDPACHIPGTQDLRMALSFGLREIEYRGIDTWSVLQHMCCHIYGRFDKPSLWKSQAAR